MVLSAAATRRATPIAPLGIHVDRYLKLEASRTAAGSRLPSPSFLFPMGSVSNCFDRSSLF
jgi:hypothetical protein